MQATSLFRGMIVAGLVVGLIGVVTGLSLTDSLPPLLQEYLAQENGRDLPDGEAVLMVLAALVLVVGLPLALFGLWKFRPWARTLYVAITVALIPFYPLTGPVVMNGWEAMFNELAVMLDGILIAMMFTGEIHQKFQAGVGAETKGQVSEQAS